MGNKPDRPHYPVRDDWRDADRQPHRRSSFATRSNSSSGSELSSDDVDSSRRGSSVRQHFLEDVPSRFDGQNKASVSTIPQTFRSDTSFGREGPLPPPPPAISSKASSIDHLAAPVAPGFAAPPERIVASGMAPPAPPPNIATVPASGLLRPEPVVQKITVVHKQLPDGSYGPGVPAGEHYATNFGDAQSYEQALPQGSNPNYEQSLPRVPTSPPSLPQPISNNTMNGDDTRPALIYFDSERSTPSHPVMQLAPGAPALFQADEDSETAIVTVATGQGGAAVLEDQFDTMSFHTPGSTLGEPIDDLDRSLHSVGPQQPDIISSQLLARPRVPSIRSTSVRTLCTPVPPGSQVVPLDGLQSTAITATKVVTENALVLKERTGPSSRKNKLVTKKEEILLLKPRGAPITKEIVKRSTGYLIKPRSTPDNSLRIRNNEDMEEIDDMESAGVQTDPLPDDTQTLIQPVMVPVYVGGQNQPAVSNLQQLPQERQKTKIVPVIIRDRGSVSTRGGSSMRLPPEGVPLGQVQLGLSSGGSVGTGSMQQSVRQSIVAGSSAGGLTVTQNVEQNAGSIKGPFMARDAATVSQRGSEHLAPAKSMYTTLTGTARLRGLEEWEGNEIEYPAGAEGTVSDVKSYRLFGEKNARAHHLELMKNAPVALTEQ